MLPDLANTPLDNELVLIALLLTLGVILYFVFRIGIKLLKRRHQVKPQAPAPYPQQPPADPQKQAALAKFKQVHASARDNRQRLKKAIASDPKQAANVLKKMMKH